MKTRNCTWKDGNPHPPKGMLPGAEERIAARFKTAGLEEPCTPGCRGWDHFDSTNHGYVIARCDECAIFDDDAAAARAHAKDCGCNWATRNDSPAAESWRRQLRKDNARRQYLGRDDPAMPPRGF